MSNGNLRDAIPSHNEDAEIATLGAVLIDPEALSTIIPLLRAEDFYTRRAPAHLRGGAGAVRSRPVH